MSWSRRHGIVVVDDPTGQNDCQLTLHTLMLFVGASNLVLSPIII
jgi:hypothetical protein